MEAETQTQLLRAGGLQAKEEETFRTFVDDVADGLGAERVVQRDGHHGVGVAGQLADGPLQGQTDPRDGFKGTPAT